ncbi:MAG: trehalose-6-phosphate synthase [Candidatus Omnitrophica bacterium]|nr:trehalose-6-phosphate synthase [Candidatus Omnitrophota bacterium]
MKRILLFILPILILVALGFTISGTMQARFTEEKLMDDLKRKARSVAESLDLSAKYILINNDLKQAHRLVDSFQKRERLQGCVIYDKDGQILAITERFFDLKQAERPYLQDILSSKNPRGALEQYKEYSVYSYILPVLDDENNVLGMVEVIYDTSYMFTTLTELWRKISVTSIALILLIVLIALLIQRQIFIIPVRRLTQWFTHFQRGETDKLQPFAEKGEFGKLISEVEQVALSIRVARRTISDQAHVRLQKEELWTEAKLKDLIHAKLGDNSLFVVSNREPYMHVLDDGLGKAVCIRPASGVVTAIHPILSACGGTWVAHGSGNADRKFVNSKDKLGVPPEDNRYILKRVWLNKEEEQGYYYGFSNEGLWPLCHNTHTRPVFKESDWQMYKAVNQKFADSILNELPATSPFIFVQDYHFTLLPKMIKDKRPDAKIALFWHIPWPTPEAFMICPYQNEILEGMLGCDLIGFHVQNHCNNFLDTANRLLESRVDTEKFSVVRSGKETFIRAFPISINPHIGDDSFRVDPIRQIEKLKKEFELENEIVAVGVDRIDYTKGIVERILAIDRFLDKYPEYKKKFVFIQLAAPSRTHIKRYHDLIGEIDELVERINWKHVDGNWKPIIYLKKHFSQDDIQPYYKLGDICIVSSLHDGMNLVAKEYVAQKDDLSGALILSQFTGAAREFTDAILVNPYSIEEFADSIKLAIQMPKEEKRRRMENMRAIIAENNIYRWAANIINELVALKKI